MHACLALPQPLRWFMGRCAMQMDESLAGQIIEQVGRTMHWHPETATSAGMASDAGSIPVPRAARPGLTA